MLMADVFSDVNLHLQGCRAYKTTGTTVAFDGSEDHLIGADAKAFWDEYDMRAKINNKLKDIEERWSTGKLIWTFENVQKEIRAYPPRGKYDAEPEGMEDEVMVEEENIRCRGDLNDEVMEDEENIRCCGDLNGEEVGSNGELSDDEETKAAAQIDSDAD